MTAFFHHRSLATLKLIAGLLPGLPRARTAERVHGVSFTRRAGFRGRRLALCAALAVGTVVFRGSIGVLLAIFLLLLIADALVPMPVGTMADADEHFARLVRRRRHDRWLGRLEWLDVLEDQHGWAAVSERHDLGVRTIPI